MGELRGETALREFTLEAAPLEIAEQLLAEGPEIIGLGVYVWNLRQTTELVALLKTLVPEVLLVLGGPEVSHEWQDQPLVAWADYLITGQADLAFAELCRALLAGRPPAHKVLHAAPPPLEQLAWPYDLYSETDIAQRILYVEASRGCPFRCAFCLSALDRSARGFDLAGFLAQMDRLYQRGARQFKFVDRTFNLDVKTSRAILEFFLERLSEQLFLHFELIPDRLPEPLKELLRQFPAGSLQLEVGVQSLNPEVQARIDRRQDNGRSLDNLRWLRQHTQAHLHTDLILGLPGEDGESFGRGFDQLLALRPQEIQLGILKRLRGAPIGRGAAAYGMRFSPSPPYEVLSSDCIPFAEMQRLKRLTRYWEQIGNSGHFSLSLPLLLGASPFQRLLRLSDWLYGHTGQLSHIALKRWFDLLFEGGTLILGLDPKHLGEALREDFLRSGVKGPPAFMRAPRTISQPPPQGHDRRQRRHQTR